jgi:hypothetical protein
MHGGRVTRLPLLVGNAYLHARASATSAWEAGFGKVRAELVFDESSCNRSNNYSRGRQRARRDLPHS